MEENGVKEEKEKEEEGYDGGKVEGIDTRTNEVDAL